MRFVPGSEDPVVRANKGAAACLLPMGITSENVAAHFKVSRAEQDQLAVVSHDKAAKAVKAGNFKDEIVPVKTMLDGKEVTISADDGVRGGTTLEQLSKLKPAFKKEGGSTTAGNASQVSDGAAATLLMTRAMAQKLKLPVLGVFRSFAVAGVPPEVRGCMYSSPVLFVACLIRHLISPIPRAAGCRMITDVDHCICFVLLCTSPDIQTHNNNKHHHIFFFFLSAGDGHRPCVCHPGRIEKSWYDRQ